MRFVLDGFSITVRYTLHFVSIRLTIGEFFNQNRRHFLDEIDIHFGADHVCVDFLRTR